MSNAVKFNVNLAHYLSLPKKDPPTISRKRAIGPHNFAHLLQAQVMIAVEAPQQPAEPKPDTSSPQAFALEAMKAVAMRDGKTFNSSILISSPPQTPAQPLTAKAIVAVARKMGLA